MQTLRASTKQCEGAEIFRGLQEDKSVVECTTGSLLKPTEVFRNPATLTFPKHPERPTSVCSLRNASNYLTQDQPYVAPITALKGGLV